MSAPSNSLPQTTSSPHLPALDGIRALAFLLVLAFHTDELWHQLGQSKLLNYVDAVLLSFWVGVDLFFVLSGFLITRILLASRGQPDYFSQFFIRRTLRIFPLYFLFLAGAAAWVMLLGTSGPQAQNATPWWAYLTFTENWVFAQDGWIGIPGLRHLWSLAVEEQFYLLWPLVIACAGYHRLRLVMVLLLILPAVLRVLVLSQGHQNGIFNYAATVTHVDPLAAGALLALLGERPEKRAWLGRHARHFMLAGLSVMAGIWLLRHGFRIEDPVVQTLGQSAVALAGFGTVAMGAFGAKANAVTGQPNWFVRAMKQPALRWIGGRSYASYVLHWPIALGLKTWLVPLKLPGGLALLVHFGLTLAMTLMAAELSWRFWETRWLALKLRLSPQAAPAA